MQKDPERRAGPSGDSRAAKSKRSAKRSREKTGREKGPICGWKKDSFLKDHDRFRRIVENARFACKKCGRVAAEESWLCRPIRLD